MYEWHTHEVIWLLTNNFLILFLWSQLYTFSFTVYLVQDSQRGKLKPKTFSLLLGSLQSEEEKERWLVQAEHTEVGQSSISQMINLAVHRPACHSSEFSQCFCVLHFCLADSFKRPSEELRRCAVLGACVCVCVCVCASVCANMGRQPRGKANRDDGVLYTLQRPICVWEKGGEGGVGWLDRR